MTDSYTVEFYSHVMHIVSNVVGRLAPGKDALDALFAGFPAGTVSGAPKVRACEIIAELEPETRGAYAGGVGYFSPDGSMDSCIVLRTAVVKDGTMHVQAGAGIVADSDPASEQRECEAKAGALFAAAREALRHAGEPGFGNRGDYELFAGPAAAIRAGRRAANGADTRVAHQRGRPDPAGLPFRDGRAPARRCESTIRRWAGRAGMRGARSTMRSWCLHGTGGTGKQFLSPQFANELYGAGQPLDIGRYFIILPDNIGHGGSSKPSDFLKDRFPAYDYADMVEAQARLLDHLGVKKLRLLMGTSMGCMHGFVWGTTRSERVQAMMPTACLPVEIAGQNRMWRKMAIDALRDDPVKGMRTAGDLLLLAGLNPVAMQAEAPTREQAEAALATRYAAAVKGRDADDLIYQLDSSRTYDPSAGLERMTMPVTWINSADDFINPPGLGIAEREAKRLPAGKFVLIPQTAETKGHGTHTWAKFWKGELVELLRRSEGE